MLSPYLILTPSHRCDAGLAIAAVRAGATGILDLGDTDKRHGQESAVRSLALNVKPGSPWGVRWDVLGDDSRSPLCLQEWLGLETCPVLVLAGLEGGTETVRDVLEQARQIARCVILEVNNLVGALAGQEAGFDGLIVKGHEAGGRVGDESTFLLLQRLHGRLTIPYWMQGGIGPDTAAAVFLAGAAGVVLGEQFWLATESPFDVAERRQWGSLDGSETVCTRENGSPFRRFSRSGPQSVGEGSRIALGQEIACARGLADKHVNTAGILQAFRTQVQTNLDAARQARALAPDSALAKIHGTRYPILQGPMTRVSDTVAFCASVESNGGLPFLALSLMTGPEVRKLLNDAKERMGDRPWGVGLLGFAPAELRQAQMEEILAARPPYALIAGGRPAQARKLEEHNISTYLHVPSPGLLEAFIRDGARKFIFEGRECGGHVGPRSSFNLWQSAIDVLRRTEVDRPDEFHLVFAGGIHDRLSAAMVAAAAAPLSACGMKIGVLMGTAYLFTREAVANDAITVEFQRQALACDETILLESGVGHATRCVNTPFAEEFQRVRAELIRAGKDADEIRLELEKLNIGRLRIASKGLARASDPRKSDAKASLVAVPEETQRREGMYMIGQVAGLRNDVVSMAQLHADVSAGQQAILEKGSRGATAPPRVADSLRESERAVAIVGMACMFPKAKDVRRYWENICQRIDAVGEVPAERWRIEDFYSEDRQARDRVYSKWGGFLEKVLFDPVKWRIPPATLKHVEPIQLLSLEVASQAVADAGYDRRPFPREQAGVLFAVAASHDLGTAYCFRTMMRHYLPQVEGLAPKVREEIYASLEKQLPEWTEDSFPGFLGNVVAGRIARELDFNGPNFTVDAACAASLAALYTAVEQLRSGTSDLMLVGGADGTNNPFGYMSFAKTHALSPRGRSRSFDDSADGIALGEGIACVVLKRLEDAERDGDKIYAVIKGVGCSSDGKNRSLTAPYPPGQARAVNRAYEDARVSPATVGLIEAHGTGTAVGDACELTTLNQVFSPHTSDKQTIGVGSVKSQIGHTKTVAGLASVIKAALSLKHRVLPATIGIDKPSTRVDWANSPFYLNTETRPWTIAEGEYPRRAGVSSFGFGGTNFHVVLEEYTGDYHPSSELDWTPRSAEVFVFQRASREEIVSALRRFEQQLADAVTEDLAGLASVVFAEESNRSGAGGVCRLAIVADSVFDLRQKLRKALTLLPGPAEVNDPSGIYHSEATPADDSTVCFLYPGQGSQSVNMLRDLVVSSAWSRDLFAEADRLLADELSRPLSCSIYPTPAFSEEERQRQTADLKDTRIAQPALGLVELFATDLLERFGIRPARVAGHSYGEHVALQVAGCLSRPDLLRLSAARGRVCAEVSESCPGAMASVQADADTTAAALKALNLDAYLANRNAPDQTVIAGPAVTIAVAIAQLPKRGLRTRSLPVSAAFHTPILTAASRSMETHLAGIAFQTPTLPVYSNMTGEPHCGQPETIRGLLARHISEPVLFEKEVRRLHADGARIFVEVGPGKVLTDLVSRILKGSAATALALDVPGRESWTQLAHVLARLSVLGLPVRWAAWFQGRGLPAGTIAEFLARTRAACTPKPSDWFLTPNKAEPAVPVACGSTSSRKRPETPPASSAIVLSQKRTVHEQEVRVQATNPSVSNQEKARTAMSTTNGVPSVNGNAPRSASSSDLFAQFQATTRILLEAQQAQNRILERYLEAQERVLLYCTDGTMQTASEVSLSPLPVADREVAAVAPPEPIPVIVPPRMPSAAPPRLGRPPVTIPVTPPRVAAAPTRPAAAAPVSVPKVVAPAAPTPAAANDGPPSTEEFREELLAVVSARTGYPADALDETLHLEAALGIDSIKTVEIFSNLKAYHKYFRADGQEEEELLAEFTKLKTLRDIINSYDRRRQAHLPQSDAVKRYEVTPIAAPLHVNGSKKNYLTATSSSSSVRYAS